MLEKAKRFDAVDTLWKLLAVRFDEDVGVCKERARELKRLGRDGVPGFDADVWMAERFSAMLRCVLAKFSQHEGLRRRLLSTGDLYIAESAHYDRVWGIGLDALDGPSRKGAMRRAEDGALEWSVGPASWPVDGNLLGKALMVTRDWLRLRDQLGTLVVSVSEWHCLEGSVFGVFAKDVASCSRKVGCENGA